MGGGTASIYSEYTKLRLLNCFLKSVALFCINVSNMSLSKIFDSILNFK